MSGAEVTLSARQLEVLTLVADGLSLAQVAEELYLSRATVKNHCANVTRMYGVHSTGEAIVLAVRDGQLVVDAQSASGARRRVQRDIGSTIRRESAQRTPGAREAGTAAVTTYRTPMVRGPEARRASIVEALVREGLVPEQDSLTD